MEIGYVGVSSLDQNTIRQEVLMKELGAEEVFIDKLSGKDTNRPELQKMMSTMFLVRNKLLTLPRCFNFLKIGVV